MIRIIALAAVASLLCAAAHALAAEIVGVTVTPHVIAPAMRYREDRGGGLAARVQLFVRGRATDPTFAGRTPAELLAAGEWAWHDLGAAVPAEEGALSVWTFNGKSAEWGVGRRFAVRAQGLSREVALAKPSRWISAATFLASDGGIQPDTAVLHVANDSGAPLRVESLRIWLPRDGRSWQTLWPGRAIPAAAAIPAGDRGALRVATGRLPLTYGALELNTSAGPIWAHLRIRREAFDIGGGWVGENVTFEAYLHLLASLHVNTGNIGPVAGYTTNPDLYRRLPLKLFSKLEPVEIFASDEWLPRVHAVEFLGEPQYGGGRPVPPQEVFDKLLPYRPTRLPTSVTHSEERIWRWYAGLSDFPHYDAYRVVAPAADSWRMYDRWQGRRIRWGAPLETVGDMCRSLRELNRPMACAFWAQGPHEGWDDRDGRTRRSPTPDELRSQAVHALASRITSLYWFNLSLKSLVAFRDTWEPMRRIGREIRMLEPLILEGDAFRFRRAPTPDGRPDWELSSIAAPDAALLFAIDTAYAIDARESVFAFGPPRPARFAFDLPAALRRPADLFRIDADGPRAVNWRTNPTGVEIEDRASRDAIYVAAKGPAVRAAIERRRLAAIAHEHAHPVDPAALLALAAAGRAK